MINKIKEALNKNKDVYAWEIKTVESKSNQLFLIKNYIEQLRDVSTVSYTVKVYNLHEINGERQLGLSLITLQHNEKNIDARVEAAVEIAKYSNNIPWEIYAGGDYYYDKSSVSDKIVKDRRGLLFEFFDRYKAMEAQIKPARYSSLELFATMRDIEYVNSKGVNETDKRTSFEIDYVVLSGNDAKDMECHNYRKVVFPEMLDFEAEIKKSAKYATDSLNARLPKSGIYPVVLMEEPLEDLFSPLVFQTSGRANFQKQSMLKLNEEIIEAAEGDKITMKSNSSVKNGLKTAKFDEDGAPMQDFTVIENGLFKKRWNDVRYAQYNKEDHTGSFGNVEINSGNMSMDEFTEGEDVVYYIMSFSSFMPDPISGTFGGEIRHGYEFSKNGITPIKGGSVSGSIGESFKNIYLSKEKVLRGEYMGPKAVKFKKLNLTGE